MPASVLAASFSLHNNLARRHDGNAISISNMEKLSPRDSAYTELSSRAGIRHLSVLYAASISASPAGGTLSHIKLTGSFGCLPVSVLLVRMKMSSCSGSWLSRCFITLVFLQLPLHMSGKSFWISSPAWDIGQRCPTESGTALWGTCSAPSAGWASAKRRP